MDSAMWRSLLRTFSFFRRMPFVRDVLTMQAGIVIYMGATFLSSIAFARLLGVNDYGRYAVLMSFVGTAYILLNLGQGTSLFVFFAEEYGKRSVHGMSAVMRNYFQVTIGHAVVLGGLAIIAPSITQYLYSDPTLGQYARVLFLYQIIDSGNSFMIILLQAMRWIRGKVFLEQAANLSFLALAVLTLVFGYGIKGIVLAHLTVSACFLLISFALFHHLQIENVLPSWKDILRTPFKDTRQYFVQGILFSFDKSLGNLFPQGLFFAMSLFAPASSVGIAKIAVQLASVPRMLLLPPVGDLSTTVLARQKSEGIRVLRKNAARIAKHALAVQAALSLAGAIVMPFLVYVFYGAAYLAAVPLALWLILLGLPAALCITNSPILRLFRRIHYSIIQACISWVVMLGVLVLLSRLISPFTGFTVAYGIGQAMPLLITTYIFAKLLRTHPSLQGGARGGG